MEDKRHSEVYNPKHYTQANRVVQVELEPLDFFKILPSAQACAFKYAVRYRYKNGMVDLDKCSFFINAVYEQKRFSTLELKMVRTYLRKLKDTGVSDDDIALLDSILFMSDYEDSVKHALDKLRVVRDKYEEELEQAKAIK